MKQCTKCKVQKNDEDFVFKNKEKGIRQSVCKECQKIYKLKHYYKNKEAHYFRNQKTHDKIKTYSNSIKKTGCKICGENEICTLDYHHLQNKEENIAKLLRGGSLKKVKEEIKKCVVLCANCHRKVHAGIIKYPVA